MEKILISACLLGENTKYDGGNNLDERLNGFLEFFELVPFCPEVEGGLPVPRKKSEIRNDAVKDEKGRNVTSYFETGADKAVAICKYLGIKIAILKENSPSCGTHHIYNGYFNGTLKEGKGVAARRLEGAGIKTYNEIEALDFLESLRQDKRNHDEAVAKSKEKAASEANNPEPKEEIKPAEKKPRLKKPSFRPTHHKRLFGEEKPGRKPNGKKPFKKAGTKPFGKPLRKPFNKKSGYPKRGPKKES